MSGNQDLKRDRRAEGDAFNQRELLRVTLSSIGDAVITTDISGNITSLNLTAQSLTGWTQEEATGQPLETVFQIVNEETGQTVENPATRALREGMIVGLANHTLLIVRDGMKRAIDDSAAPIRGPTGEVAGVVLVFRDVTERREQERQVQDTLDYVESILATVREPLLVLDRDLRVITANRSFYRVFQVAAEETENRLIYELGNGQWNIPELRTLLEEVLAQNHHFDDFEVEHDLLVIGRKVMLLNARRLVGQDDHTDRILLAIEDVTERQQALAALEDSERRYRRLFEAAQDGILVLTTDTGQITDANPFIEDIMGYSRDELLGKRLWDVGLFKDEAENAAKFRELQQEGYVRYDHLPLETKSGETTEVEFVSNIYAVDGHRVIQCNIRDISDRRRLEQETERQAQELTDLDRRKDEFLAMLSHELRNPLAPIVNAARLLRLQTNENSIQRHAREVIERQSANLTHLVDDLLEVSRITTGRIRLRLERVAFCLVVERAVETVRPELESRRQELTVSFPPEQIWLDADAVRLEQVAVNLLTNAAKYTNEGGHIWLSVEQQESNAILRVRDTGIGIAPEVLPRIFDLFAQAERSLARSEGGLGIGLALVKRLTEMHGGSVSAYSALGQGSEFEVHLPVAPEPNRPQPQSPPDRTGVITTQSLRVLVVDDSVDMSRMFQMTFELDGHQVRLAHDGPTALQVALDFQPDIVLLDIGLPGWDGYEVARRMRQEPALRDVVLVAMTGYGMDSDREQASEAGFDHHLVKPPDFEKLQQIFATIAGR